MSKILKYTILSIMSVKHLVNTYQLAQVYGKITP